MLTNFGYKVYSFFKSVPKISQFAASIGRQGLYQLSYSRLKSHCGEAITSFLALNLYKHFDNADEHFDNLH